MRSILLAIVISASLFAYEKDDIINDYEEGNFKQVCLQSASYYKNNGKNERLLSMIGDACLKSDFINPLGYIAKNLLSTPDYRQNASYFTTILLHKKLLYQFINDGIDLSNIRLPKTQHILSLVFEHIVMQDFSKIDDKIEVKLDQTHKVLLSKQIKNENSWLLIEEFRDGELIKKRWYI
ncbi:MAG: hypothetical protein IBX44_07060 [Sulfurospirillum sp.]|nr:hypothetical protein [Sulfurospirillum sp.]